MNIEKLKKKHRESEHFKTEWLTFGKLETPEIKTDIWQVISVKGVFLGDIKWFSRWRQYAFFPEEETIYNQQYLNGISSFINMLMQWRKD